MKVCSYTLEPIYWPAGTKNNCWNNCDKVIHIDDLIYPTIKLLNDKGYKTCACCSGHIEDYKLNISIGFENCLLNKPPLGFKFEQRFENDTLLFLNIRYPLYGLSYIDKNVIRQWIWYIIRSSYIVLFNYILYKWAKKLKEVTK